MKTMKEMPLDLYSMMQGKKQLLIEIETLLEKGYSEEEVIKHIRRIYQKR